MALQAHGNAVSADTSSKVQTAYATDATNTIRPTKLAQISWKALRAEGNMLARRASFRDWATWDIRRFSATRLKGPVKVRLNAAAKRSISQGEGELSLGVLCNRGSTRPGWESSA